MNVREIAGKTAMRELIEALIDKCEGIRPAAREIGTSHQNLMNWRDNDIKPNEITKFLAAMEKARKILKIPKSEMWSKMLGAKK